MSKHAAMASLVYPFMEHLLASIPPEERDFGNAIMRIHVAHLCISVRTKIDDAMDRFLARD
jgi:spore maturation protein SpmA